MRAVVFGLIGVVLAVGGAGAAGCRAGHMVFISGSKTFDVAETSTTRTRFNGLGAERTIFRGRLDGRPFIVDIQGVQGSSTAFISYSGHYAEKTALIPHWGTLSGDWTDKDLISIDTGPLKGDWQASCR